MLLRERENQELLAELAAPLDALRRETPWAPLSLHERVRSLAPAAPAPKPARSRRALVFALAGAVLAAAFGAAAIRGIVASSGGGGGGRQPIAESSRGQKARDNVGGGPALAPQVGSTVPEAIPPSGNRAQDYRVFLRLHVRNRDDLSAKTKQALDAARSYGGYVGSVDYAVGRDGDAALELRIPIDRVQDALVRFSGLGTIVEQHVSIADLQGQIDVYGREIGRLVRRAGVLRATLRDDSISDVERARVEARLAQVRRSLTELRRSRAGLARQGRFATVSLQLTTREVAAAPPPRPGRLERAIDDAGSVLVKELAVVMYALIVLGPLTVLVAIGIWGFRIARRRADERLLERV